MLLQLSQVYKVAGRKWRKILQLQDSAIFDSKKGLISIRKINMLEIF